MKKSYSAYFKTDTLMILYYPDDEERNRPEKNLFD